MEILTFHWPPQTSRPAEDRYHVLPNNRIFLVADGVTRTLNEEGSYPEPSPAADAAEWWIDGATRYLEATVPEDITERDLRAACLAGNVEVRGLNAHLGLWEHHDYWTRDLAGTVGAVLALCSSLCLRYAFLTDCGIGCITRSGKLRWVTKDLLAPARKSFPTLDARGGSSRERQIRIRRDFRNQPAADRGGYGVFTGEEAALRFLQVEKQATEPGETIIVFTDGLRPFLEDFAFRLYLLGGSAEVIREFVDDRSSPSENPDEKTLIVVRT